MHDTTFTAGPLSYSQSCDTFRPRLAVFRPARRTGLGRTAFVDFLERDSVRDRFVAEPVSERRRMRRRRSSPSWFWRASRPTRCRPRCNRNAAPDRARACVGNRHGRSPPWRAASRYAACAFAPVALSPAFPPRVDRTGHWAALAGRKCGEIFQAEIDTHTGTDRARPDIGHFNHDVQEPVAARILRKVGSVLDLAVGKRAAAEYAESVAGETERVALAFQITPLQWYPAERFPAAIAQVGPTALATRLRVLLARRVDRAGEYRVPCCYRWSARSDQIPTATSCAT